MRINKSAALELTSILPESYLRWFHFHSFMWMASGVAAIIALFIHPLLAGLIAITLIPGFYAASKNAACEAVLTCARHDREFFKQLAARQVIRVIDT
jgi:hypothetical protein